jgi:uncharacterized protein YjbI with pentapeptide repeats
MSELTRQQVLMSLISGRGPAYLRGVNLSSLDLSGAAWLAEADLRFADLSNANLRRANLKKACLERANLNAANLMGANLEEADCPRIKANVANLNVANLRGANLREANLVGANLVRADLEEADLDGADLEGANLQGSNLRRARLSNANLKMANLEGADLTDAIMESGVAPGGWGAEDEPPLSDRGFSGIINAMGLGDLMQLACFSRLNMTIQIRSAKGSGSVYLGGGRVLHSKMGDLEGEDALMEMLQWQKGRFKAFPFVPTGAVTIDKPVEHLIIEASRRTDETQHADKASALANKLKQYMPFTAQPSFDLIELLKTEGRKVGAADQVEVKDIFDSSDSADILCSITAGDEIFIAPLRYIRLDESHPLFDDVADYYKEAEAE